MMNFLLSELDDEFDEMENGRASLNLNNEIGTRLHNALRLPQKSDMIGRPVVYATMLVILMAAGVTIAFLEWERRKMRENELLTHNLTIETNLGFGG
eukprot:m.345233 g.345233  ORF g.345233 m.345233 type:complete len:97 (+) comp25954_c0_seq1:328-618(+)